MPLHRYNAWDIFCVTWDLCIWCSNKIVLWWDEWTFGCMHSPQCEMLPLLYRNFNHIPRFGFRLWWRHESRNQEDSIYRQHHLSSRQFGSNGRLVIPQSSAKWLPLRTCVYLILLFPSSLFTACNLLHQTKPLLPPQSLPWHLWNYNLHFCRL